MNAWQKIMQSLAAGISQLRVAQRVARRQRKPRPGAEGSMRMSTIRIATVSLILSLWGAMAYAGVHHYYYTDPQGTVLAKADASGAIIATYDYAPYGTAAASMGPAPNGPGYTGHVNDPNTALVYMQARYYDPSTGRFLSIDPVGPSPGNSFNFNRYDYANDNPARYIDPDGRTCTEANKTYTCQIDKVVTQENGKLVTRNATAEDHKTYAGLEKSLTKAVNAARFRKNRGYLV